MEDPSGSCRDWVRRALLRGFPYSVVYEESATEVVVLAVAHDKQKPGYWRER